MSRYDKIIAGVLFFFFGLFYFAFAAEEITITTYYPSPYGSYKELRTQRMAIGASYYDGSAYCWGDSIVGTCSQIDPGTPTPDVDLIIEGIVAIGTATPSSSYKLQVIDSGSGSNAKTAIYGLSSDSYGIIGASTNSDGVYGQTSGTVDEHHGVYGYDASASGALNIGVYGYSSFGKGVKGAAQSGTGVLGLSTSSYGVQGTSTSGSGVYGTATGSGTIGVYGVAASGTGVTGSGGNYGVQGFGTGANSVGLNGEGRWGVVAQGTNTGVWASGPTYSGYFDGPFYVVGDANVDGLISGSTIESRSSISAAGNIDAASYSAGGITGFTGNIGVKNTSGSNCTISVTSGLITGTTC